jgi:hypothetical protein
MFLILIILVIPTLNVLLAKQKNKVIVSDMINDVKT